jgi:hypothetical protein
MEFPPDELAGIVDLFGALDRPTLRRGCVELAFKQGDDREPEHFDTAIDDAVESYHLLALEDSETELLVPGPVAFPTLPEGARDLPHILDAEEHSPDRQRLAEAAERRFRDDTADAIETDDREWIANLLDISYELEVWAPVELSGTRNRLGEALK